MIMKKIKKIFNMMEIKKVIKMILKDIVKEKKNSMKK
jgi:hypothetical protein